MRHSTMKHSATTRTLGLLAGLALAGCATVHTVKVPSPTQYRLSSTCAPDDSDCRTWNQVQAEADAIEGFRYYLPRAFVAVKKEFAVGGDTYYVGGTLDPLNRVVALDAGSLPEALRPFLGAGGVKLSRIHDPKGLLQDRQQAETAPETEKAPETETTVETKPKAERKLLADSKNFLKDSTVSDPDVLKPDAAVTLVVQVNKDALDPAKNPALDGAAKLDTERLYLVPFSKGGHTLDGVVEVSNLLEVGGNEGENRRLRGQIEGSKIPAHASYAVGLEETVQQDAKEAKLLHLLHSPVPNVHNSFAGPKEEEKPKEDETQKKETKKTEETQAVTSAKVVTSGDPATSPLMGISDLYDVLLLPDYEEQYAIGTRARLGKATAEIGLENGWMLERAMVEMDNKELGSFVIQTATKLVDVGIARIQPKMKEAEAAEEAPPIDEQEAERAVEEARVQLLLRVDVLDYATVGLHPLPKTRELVDLVNLRREYPKVDYRTRREITLSLASVTTKPAATGTRNPQRGPADAESPHQRLLGIAHDLGVLTSVPEIKNVFTEAQIQTVGAQWALDVLEICVGPVSDALLSRLQKEEVLEALATKLREKLQSDFKMQAGPFEIEFKAESCPDA